MKFTSDWTKKDNDQIVSRLIYIISDIDIIISHKYPNIVYIIGETKNVKKINFYRDIIKNSLTQYNELKGKSSINLGRPAYYYFKSN